MGVVDLVPHQWMDGDHARGSLESKHIDEETISYHALFTFDVIVCFLVCASIRYTTVA
jgi:hypothetical protein